MSDNRYWASLPPEEVGAHIVKRVEEYAHYLDATGHYSKIVKSYRSYYGLSEKGFDSNEITAGGKVGELKKLRVNFKRAALLTIFQMATKEPPAFVATAKGTDSESLSQTERAEGLIDEYQERKGLGKNVKIAGEMAMAMTEGWLVSDWDGTLGEPIRPDIGEDGQLTDQVINQGDAVVCVRSPLDVIRDTQRTDEDLPWVIIHHEKSKWDLIARYPKHVTEIMAAQRCQRVKRLSMGVRDLDKGDLISVYELRHRITSAMPNGRRVLLLNDAKTVLDDSAWEWEDVKARVIAPSPLLLTPMHFSPSFDLEATQDAIDIVFSSIVTNAATFGVQNVWSRKGDGLTVTALSSGMNHFQTMEAPPQGINLTQIPSALFEVLGHLTSALNNNSGTPSVTRGEPPPGVKAGNAMAALISQAMQFNDGFQESIYEASEAIATDILELIQEYATTKRQAYITNRKTKRASFDEYDQNDVAQVVGFRVERVNPAFKTLGGKTEAADKLLERGMIKRPEQYINFLKTGNLDTLTNYDQTKYQHVQAENDQLKKGIKPTVMISDDPILHMQEHDSVLHSPEARENPDVVQATLAHMQEHEIAWQALAMQRPALMAALNIPPPPMLAPPPGDPNAQQAPSDAPSNPAAPSPDTALEVNNEEQVTYPTNPVSGETFNPETGGL